MKDLTVGSSDIKAALSALQSLTWVVPTFQRDFVWSTAQVEELVESVLRARPIGMVTVWEQTSENEIQFAPVALDDGTRSAPSTATLGGSSESPPPTWYAILDGRQRLTALAMAMGGLRQTHGNRKYAGAFYIDLSKSEAKAPVVTFVKKAAIEKQSIGTVAAAIAAGLLPLAMTLDEVDWTEQWFERRLLVQESSTYPEESRPSDEERQRRGRLVSTFHQNINDTVLAVFTVPASYGLGEICEIFETLNMTGTTVSTVDLIHSWLVNDTNDDEGGPIDLRDWLQELGGIPGGVGWSSKDQRPELVAQIVTACHVASDKKFDPRPLGKGDPAGKILSVKAPDLLRTPTGHWRQVVGRSAELASYLADFQYVVAGGAFGYASCPYPASASIYVALRWHLDRDKPAAPYFTVAQLNAAYRAFFWRNVLQRRYDQGFLTQIGTDLKDLKALLIGASSLTTDAQWIKEVDAQLDVLLKEPPVDAATLKAAALDGSISGAMKNATRLVMMSRTTMDIIDHSISLDFATGGNQEAHHVFPKAWLKKNRQGALDAALSDYEEAGIDVINSAANLMPLSPQSNKKWRDYRPGVALAQSVPTFASKAAVLGGVFIDEIAYGYLVGKEDTKFLEDSGAFWERRAGLIGDDLAARQRVVLGG